MSKVKEGFKKYDYEKKNHDKLIQSSQEFYQHLNQRRSIRSFSPEDIPQEVLENIVRAASTAPSGAHKQPWFFAIIRSATMKKEIREAAEQEEYINYHGRMSEEWLEDLEKFNTNWHKPYLEIAPALIVVFKKTHDITENGKEKN